MTISDRSIRSLCKAPLWNVTGATKAAICRELAKEAAVPLAKAD